MAITKYSLQLNVEYEFEERRAADQANNVQDSLHHENESETLNTTLSGLQTEDRKNIEREFEQTDVKQLQQKLADYQRRCDELEQQLHLEQQQNWKIQNKLHKLKKENAEAQKSLLDANRKIYQFQERQLHTSEKLQLTQHQNQGEA